MLTVGMLTLAVATGSVLTPVRVFSRRPSFKPETRVVRVLEKDKIRDSSRLPEVLGNIPGFFGHEYGPSGSLSSPSVRGSSGEGVLVELDGIRLNSPLTGSADLGRIPLLGIGRVEVVNGAGIGGASGGTIRLDTSEEVSSSMALGLGSWGKKTFQAQFGEENFSLAIQKESATNDYEFLDRGAPASRKNATLDTTTLFCKGKKVLGDPEQNPLTARFMALVDFRDQGTPGAINFPTPKARQEDSGLLASFSLEGNLADAEGKISLSQRSDRCYFQDPDAVFSPKNSNLGVDSSELKTDWKKTEPVGGHFPSLSLSIRQDETTGTLKNQENIARIHVKDEVLGDWGTLEGELGVDHFSNVGTAFSPRLGLSRIDGDFRTHGSLGSAFRAPTFNERYWPEDSFAKGNPAIRPERTSSIDLGVDRRIGFIKTGLTLFASLSKDQIHWQPVAGKWTPLNLSDTIGRGSEFEVSLDPLPEFSLSGTYTFCQTTSAGKQLVQRPMDQLNLSGRLGKEGRKISCDLAYVGERFTTPDNTEKMPAYWLLGLSADWRIGDETLSARVDNILDSAYQTVPYYPMPGRSFLLGLSHAF